MNNTEARRNSNAFRFLFRKTFVYIAVIMGGLTLQSCISGIPALFFFGRVFAMDPPYDINDHVNAYLENSGDSDIVVEFWAGSDSLLDRSIKVGGHETVCIATYHLRFDYLEDEGRFLPHNNPIDWISYWDEDKSNSTRNTVVVVLDDSGNKLKRWDFNSPDSVGVGSFYNKDSWKIVDDNTYNFVWPMGEE